MEFSFKKLTLALMVMGVSLTSTNATATPTDSIFVGFDGIMLQPRPDIARITYENDGENSEGVPLILSSHQREPNYHFGFDVFGGVNFGCNNDITLGWMRFSDHDNYKDEISSVDSLTTVTNNITNTFNTQFAEIGHTFTFNNPSTVRFGGGIEHANLHFNNFSFSNFSGAANNTFNGYGPRAEGDFNFVIAPGFAFFTNANLSLLVGSSKVIAFEGDTDVVFDVGLNSTIVPHLGIRTGVSYTFCQQANCSPRNNAVTIRAGWQAETYLNSIFGAFTPGEGGAIHTFDNTANQGFFVGVVVHSDRCA